MKFIRGSALLLATLMVLSCVLLAGCQTEQPQSQGETQYEISNYQGQLAEGQKKSDYNKALFYRNDKKTSGADPFVLDNTAIDGYYYMYVTERSLFCYRSKDLMEWEPIGNSLDNLDYGNGGSITEIRRVTWSEIWAPEVVYDPDDGRYYMFFSATPEEDKKVKAGNGVRQGHCNEQMLVAVSEYPDREFRLVNFMDPASCGEENLHTFNTVPGRKDANGNVIDAFPHYFAKYLLFDPVEYLAFSDANGGHRAEYRGGYEGSIDPHPYVDDDGTKYLFWVDSSGPDRLCGMKMENWLKPDWSTATVLTYHGFYTVEDWRAAQAGQSVPQVTYEPVDTTINEGAQIVKHNGLYYLTYSMGAYSDSSYQVGQAISENILGPYRKLTEEEGAIVISGNTSGSQEISGTGHHGFVTAGDQLLMIYHRHNDVIVGGGARNHAVDEMTWVTIKDKDGNDLDVMYANGPTCTVQPKIEAHADYVNIADEATVSGSDDAAFLNDGLLSIYKYANPEFIKYIQETTINKTTTFTFDFDEARPVRAVMVYNSKMEFTAFDKIAKVELVCEEDGKEVVRYIENIQFTAENYQANDFDGAIYYIVPASAAYAEFNELNVKSVRITIDVPEGQSEVGISEVRILGK